MGLSECSGMDQELFKCKPAIMRAFQAAKGAHKVIAGLVHLCFMIGSMACFAVIDFLLHNPSYPSFYQGGGDKDDDYVTRIEFRLLLGSLGTVMMTAAGLLTVDGRCISSSTSSFFRSLTTSTPGPRCLSRAELTFTEETRIRLFQCCWIFLYLF